jgi:parallel beta-helix repeat protein
MWGIFLGASSNNAFISNTVINNGHQGIYFQISCNNNLVKGNIASNNDYGIYLQNSRDNILSQNSLLENRKTTPTTTQVGTNGAKTT